MATPDYSIVTKPGLAATCEALRRVQCRYAHRVSDALASELNLYVDNNNQITDLTDEICILRMQVGNNLAAYDRIASLPVESFGPTLTPYQQHLARESALNVPLAELNASVDRVRDMAVAMGKIQASRNGKLDVIVLNQMAQSLSAQVDLVLEQYVEANTRTEAANRIGDLLQVSLGQMQAGTTAKGNNGSVLPVISSMPSRISADEIVRAMAGSVPVCDEADAVVSMQQPQQPTINNAATQPELQPVLNLTPVAYTQTHSYPAVG